MGTDDSHDLSPWDEEHARRVLQRIGRAQARAHQAQQRHDHARRIAAEHTDPGERAFHEREAQQHLEAKHRHEAAIEIQTMHLRHVFRSDEDFHAWLDAHSDELDGGG